MVPRTFSRPVNDLKSQDWNEWKNSRTSAYNLIKHYFEYFLFTVILSCKISFVTKCKTRWNALKSVNKYLSGMSSFFTDFHVKAFSKLYLSVEIDITVSRAFKWKTIYNIQI